MTLKKEDIILIAQLLNTQKELAEKLNKELARKDAEKTEKIKRDMLKMQKRIAEILY